MFRVRLACSSERPSAPPDDRQEGAGVTVRENVASHIGQRVDGGCLCGVHVFELVAGLVADEVVLI